MNISQLNRIEELREQQKRLKKYVEQYNAIGREINSTYKQCKHPLKFIHSTSSDEFEGRSYTRTMCIDCGEDWEMRSKYIVQEEYFNSYKIEKTTQNINKLLKIRDKYADSDKGLYERINDIVKSLI